MPTWPRHPVIYEINTWAWLNHLSRTHQKRVDLATVPESEWDGLAARGFDAAWLMGVWERSPAGVAVSMQNEGLLQDFRRAPTLDILIDAGCTTIGNRVCFPPDLVMDSIAKAGKRPCIRGRNGRGE